MKNINTKIDTTLLITLSLVAVFLLIYSALLYSEWSQNYSIHPQNFIRIDVREKPITYNAIKEAEAKEPEEMTMEEFICTFDWDCRTAIAIAKAESGLYTYAVNKNTDGSWDFGCWQLNEKWHLKPKGLDRGHAFDCKKSTETAYQIYQEWDGTFNAWSSFKNGSYRKFIK